MFHASISRSIRFKSIDIINYIRLWTCDDTVTYALHQNESPNNFHDHSNLMICSFDDYFQIERMKYNMFVLAIFGLALIQYCQAQSVVSSRCYSLFLSYLVWVSSASASCMAWDGAASFNDQFLSPSPPAVFIYPGLGQVVHS